MWPGQGGTGRPAEDDRSASTARGPPDLAEPPAQPPRNHRCPAELPVQWARKISARARRALRPMALTGQLKHDRRSVDEAIVKRVPLEVHGDELDPRWHCDTRLGQPAQLPALRIRMVDFEDSQRAHHRRPVSMSTFARYRSVHKSSVVSDVVALKRCVTRRSPDPACRRARGDVS